MRKIIKGNEPTALANWKSSNPTLRYQNLPGNIRKSIRNTCISEQNGLCAYCCAAITTEKSHNEHVEAQDTAQDHTLDFSNIIASCNTKGQCGRSHSNQPLPLTPLMLECETELEFFFSGLVKGLSDRAKTAINVLNLGAKTASNRNLVAKRKIMIDALLYECGVTPDEFSQIEDDDLLIILRDDLLTPSDDQQLRPYAPVLVNVVNNILGK